MTSRAKVNLKLLVRSNHRDKYFRLFIDPTFE